MDTRKYSKRKFGVDTIENGIKLEALAWALVLYPGDRDTALRLAGYDVDAQPPVLAEQLCSSKHVKARVAELKAWNVGAPAGSAGAPEPAIRPREPEYEELTLDAAMAELWRMAKSESPPPGPQVTALNNVVTHLMKRDAAAKDGEIEPLHIRVRDGAFKTEPGVQPPRAECWFCGAAPENQNPAQTLMPETAKPESSNINGLDGQIRQVGGFEDPTGKS